MIRVLIVDDHLVVRAGLRLLLGAYEDIEIVGAAADGHEALVLAADYEPDVVLMDLSMPWLDGIETTRRLGLAHPDMRVLILTSFSDRERLRQALAAGAIGYLLKDADPCDIVSGVRNAAYTGGTAAAS